MISVDGKLLVEYHTSQREAESFYEIEKKTKGEVQWKKTILSSDKRSCIF